MPGKEKGFSPEEIDEKARQIFLDMARTDAEKFLGRALQPGQDKPDALAYVEACIMDMNKELSKSGHAVLTPGQKKIFSDEFYRCCGVDVPESGPN